ncbi:MAG: putative O-methyltransferase YrrM [Saprospiraceae bacterium]|jgi:predicted O-methyltransferase YrrM
MGVLKDLYRLLSPKFQNFFLDYKLDANPRYGPGAKMPAIESLEAIISANSNSYSTLIKEILSRCANITSLEANTTKRGLDFKWDNGYFPGLDVAVLYILIATKKPQRIIEIGSGTSTMIISQAIHDYNLNAKITSIDPQPRAFIDQLADQVYRQPLHKCDIDIAEQLSCGDILFLDGSHRLLPNSDVMVFFLEILPKLKSGVIVQIHDIYLPYDYPGFMCQRMYSEQYALAIAMLNNPSRYKVLAPNYYISEQPIFIKQLLPLWGASSLKNVEKHGGSFWFEVV